MATQPQPNAEVPRIPPQSTAIINADSPSVPALALQQAPTIVLEEAARAAKALQQIIESKPKKVVLNGKTYLQFEDWQTLGRFYGVTAVGKEATYVEFGEGRNLARGFEATAEALLVSTNQVISSASAMCLDDETNWSGKPLFQLKSMAQTRACAKALRNVLAWVVVMAGYAPTPAEEVEGGAPRSIAPRMACNPVPPEDVQRLCEYITQARDLPDLKIRYLQAAHEAKTGNDRAALDAFIRVKDARKRELA